jgi:hypothetical protein
MPTTVLVRRLLLLSAMLPLPAVAQSRWTLTETLRIGGGEAGPTLFLQIRSIDADSKGRIFVYDRRTQDIRVFGPDGAFIRTVGRQGSGPGELRNAEGIRIDQQGRIWVRDAANSRFTVFSPEGEFEKNWVMKFCWSQGTWHPQVDRQNRIVDHDCVVPTGGGRAMENVVVAYRPDFAGVDTLSPRPACGTPELGEAATWVRRSEKSTVYMSVPFAPRPIQALGRSGETWCAPNPSRYEILRLVPGARDTVRITREIAPVSVTKAERDSIIGVFDARGPSGLDFNRIPRTKPIIEQVTIDDQGRPWVRRANAQKVVEFDVYDTNGKPVATVAFPRVRTPGWPFIVRGEHVFTVVLDEDDVPHVVRYQIDRR